MEAKHTTGPWTVTGSGGRWEQRLSIRADNWGCVAHIGVDRGLPHWDEPQRANARLIAAAPEMLEALTRLSDQCERLRLPGQRQTDAEANALAVIAKATQ